MLPLSYAAIPGGTCTLIGTSTPLGYQTNLMVYGPGRYRFTDYMRIGIPLSLVVAALALGLIPLVWGF